MKTQVAVPELRFDFAAEMNIKGITEADRKFVAKTIQPHLDAPAIEVYNPLSGWSKKATLLVSNLVWFTQRLIYSEFNPAVLKHYGISSGSAIASFDRARMIILKIDRDVYSNVID